MTAPRVVVAGGHSAGHIEPRMNFADALPRGYLLELIPPVPLPRTLNRALLQTPVRLRDSVRTAGAVLDRVRAEFVPDPARSAAMSARASAAGASDAAVVLARHVLTTVAARR